MSNPAKIFKNQSIGDPVIFSSQTNKSEIVTHLLNKNWLYVNPITNSIRRVNYVVEQFGDVWEQKEVVNLELWTNGTIHPKQAIQNACLELSTLFSNLSTVQPTSFKFVSSLNRFKKIKTEKSGDTSLLLDKPAKDTNPNELNSEKLTILFDLDIGNLNISLKTYLALKQGKIENLGNLLRYKKSDLIRFLSLSQIQMDEIDSALLVFGLSF